MKRNYLIVCTALFVAACGSSEKVAEAPAASSAAAPPASEPAPPPMPAPEDTVATSSGTKLRYFRDVLDSDQPQKPSFELEAERFSMTTDNVYFVEKATAVAYGQDGTETRFEAGGGEFDDNTKTTKLTGDVVCSMGTQRVEMQDVVWTNETQTAATPNRVIVSDGETRLQAASMEYNTDTKTLRLPNLSGVVSTKSQAAADAAAGAEPGAFESIEVKKGGLGEFVDGQLQHIAGGVEIALRAADPSAKPMVLAAEKIAFAWDEGERTKPKSIGLDGGVSVDGPQGLVTANTANLNLAENTLEFAGNVQGKSDSIESFDAERIVYDMKSGDSEMSNLVARGISMGAPSGEAKSGAADFSTMNIERAGRVVSQGGQVKNMSGGVSISLQPRDAGGKPMKLNAGEAIFSWSGDGGQPTAIAMRGSVRVDGPQGAIRAERGDFDLAKKQLVFSGKVNGSLPQLERFDSDKVTFNIESGDALMTNVTAKGLVMGTEPQGDEPAKDGEKKTGYSRMDIESAPEVSLTGQQLNWMRGGVSLTMHAADPKEAPMTLKAQELTFAYGKESASPERVSIGGGVDVQRETSRIQSDTGELDLEKQLLTFDGNVRLASPGTEDATATRITYNLATGERTTKGFVASRIQAKPTTESAKQ
ncbi:MAG: LPS export ABC transporter periplasmic protein LptC [Candidatus Hydrogenedentes bacterium]|nr:LPS export ABC transporter periplasmic protein LptC [Candidatus Hydrogenedentota bacterium]